MQEIKPTLGLAMIVKYNEPPEMLKRAIDSVKEYIDDIFVTITKNKDDDDCSALEKVLKEYKAHISYFKWVNDFAIARNFNVSQITTPYYLWMDVDDIILNPQNLRKILDQMVAYNQAAIFLTYWYQVDLDKNGDVAEIIVEHKRERLIRNDGTFKWIGSLHETLIEQQAENVLKTFSSLCTVVHLSSAERTDINIDRNIKILEEQARREVHKDPRTLVYLAKAYYDKGKSADEANRKIFFDLALLLFTEYLEGSGQAGKAGYIESSGWPEERATAWEYISEIARETGKLNVAVRALHNAIIEAPEFPQFYVDLAMVYAMKQDYPKAKHWLMLATSVDIPKTTLITTPRELKTRALEVDYNIALAEGNLDRAEEDSEKLVKILPNVPVLQERLELIKEINKSNKASQSIVYLGKYLEEKKEETKVLSLIEAIPTDLQQEKFVAEMRNRFLPARVWKDNEISILCGPCFEQWSPKSIKTGLGGSEEAVVYLSKELTKLGWHVTVYANPGADAGDHEGVTYTPYYMLNPKDAFNVLILWRSIGFVDVPDLNARYVAVWMHDYPNCADFTVERVNKVNKVFVLSDYHNSLLKMAQRDGSFVTFPENKVMVTANGITLSENFGKKKVSRNPYRCIYTSSYDRGLIYLLNMWPEIKKEVPQAELHIFYGWNLFDVIHKNNPARLQWKAQMIDLMKQPGIFEHGRIGHEQLEEELMKSGLWTYPTEFAGEIHTISAAKAQAFGAIPITMNRFALQTTVRNGIKIDMDIEMKEGQEEFKKNVIEMLKDHKKQEEIRVPMMKWAQDYFLWSHIANKWNNLFKEEMKPHELKGKAV